VVFIDHELTVLTVSGGPRKENLMTESNIDIVILLLGIAVVLLLLYVEKCKEARYFLNRLNEELIKKAPDSGLERIIRTGK
jgi:hypothetical protein